MRRIRTGVVGLAAAAILAAAPATAQTITEGVTFSVATAEGACAAGDHFHSNSGGVFGNPAGRAEVGNFALECVRGLSEYDLGGLETSSSVFVTFAVADDGGLFAGVNDFPFSGTINVVAYAGDNLEDVADYEAASTAAVGSFDTAGLMVGSVLSFDITGLFNAAILGGGTSLGIRLERAGEGPTNRGAWTFGTFRLTNDDQTSVGIVPEPSTVILLASGLVAVAGVGHLRRRRRA